MRHKGIARILSLAVFALLSAYTPANAQDAAIWGWVIEAQTLKPLVGEVSIIHLNRVHTQFFHVRTNATGAYEMKDLPAGEKIVIARAEGYGFAWQRVVLVPGQALGPIEFALERAATLEGQVVDEQGLPLAGATVRLAFKDMPPVVFGWQTGEVETDATGNFRIAGVTPSRDFYLEASHPRFPTHLSDAGLRALPGEALRGAVLTLRAGARLTGRVLDGAGNSIAGAEVRLIGTRLRQAIPAGLRPMGLAGELHRVDETDATGQFSFEGLADGTRRLFVRHPQFEPHQQTLELDRVLSPAVSLEVRLQPRTQ